MKHPCSNSNIVTQNLPESLEKYKFTDLKDVVITHLGNSTTYKKSGRQLTTKQLLKPMTEFQIRDFFSSTPEENTRIHCSDGVEVQTDVTAAPRTPKKRHNWTTLLKASKQAMGEPISFQVKTQ